MMGRARYSATVEAPLAQVWAVVRDFNGQPAWHPLFRESALEDGEDTAVGVVRRLSMPDGQLVREQLVTLDDREHILVYRMLSGPLPVTDALITLSLAAAGDGRTTVTYSGMFETATPEELDVAVRASAGAQGAWPTALAGLSTYLPASVRLSEESDTSPT